MNAIQRMKIESRVFPKAVQTRRDFSGRVRAAVDVARKIRGWGLLTVDFWEAV